MSFGRVSAHAQGCPPKGLLALFAEPVSAASTGHIDQPPPKRRKLDRTDSSRGASCPVDGKPGITLARVDINLLFADNEAPSLGSSKAAAWDEPKEVYTTLQSLDMIDATTFRLRLATIEGVCFIDCHIQSETLAMAIDDLRRAMKLNKPARPRKASHVPGLIHSQYLLCQSITDGTFHFTLQTRIIWREASSLLGHVRRQDAELLPVYFPNGRHPNLSTMSTPRDFYESVHVPDRSQQGLSPSQTPQVRCQLYPFQVRAVRWMLRREGVDISGNGIIPHHIPTSQGRLPHAFHRATDAEGRDCFVSHLLGIVTTDVSSITTLVLGTRGGILAEEMGLGKTVELITLITLHKPPYLATHQSWDDTSQSYVRRSAATLIITPPSILQQWKTEIAAHAPHLKVLHYEGLRVGHGTSDNEKMVAELLAQDVVLTTYNVLASEIHYTGVRQNRGLRHQKKYEPRRSPLVQILWWRVCLDEAQMVESGISNAATVARLIPRCNAWAVSGTPVRRDIKDLLGLLIFLRYEPYCHSTQLWNRLVTDFKNVFKEIFSQIALRHTKDQVRGELHLPPQKRVIINVPFTPVEEQHYAHLFQQMCDDCGLDHNGNPLTEAWDPDSPTTIEKMRSWLTRLRQTCLHPEVGVRNRRALGRGDGPLRTVDEVLEVMVEQNETAVRAEERAFVLSQIRRGQILENANQSHAALEVWLQALEQSQTIVKACRLQLAAETVGPAPIHGNTNTGARDEEEMASVRHIGIYRQRLRSALELEHACTFFEASAYYQIKSNSELTPPNSFRYLELEKAEEQAYGSAKQLRKELLSEVHCKAAALMKLVEGNARGKSHVAIPEMILPVEQGGIESRKIIAKIDQLCNALDRQRRQLDDWRDKLTGLQLEPLVDGEEAIEVKGDEYETSTRQQDEIYVYMEALGAIISDRHDALTGQKNGRIDHEIKFALQKARSGEGHCPDLVISLMARRSALLPHDDLGSLRGGISDLRALRTTLDGCNTRAAAELGIVEETLQTIQQVFNEQTKAVAGLLKELDVFRDTMNSRLEFYRQLQQISDSVAPYDEDLEPDATDVILSQRKVAEAGLSAKIASLRAKGRYLMHLRTDSRLEDTQRTCVICQQSFEVGALTVCGHQFCKECMRLWLNEHRSCPICKKHLNRNDLHQITYKPQELTLQEDGQSVEPEESVGLGQTSIYSGISDSTLCKIKNIDLDGSFGMKIDTLARHILWIRENDPGSKSIVFSQYRDFLDVLGRAFAQFKIGFTGIDRKGGTEKFKSNPGIECFLLHAKAHCSGLNLVNATHVFLCEPLINTAIELQAIARVHRIGQYQPTTVWMYLVSGTVEESIYDISVSRRMLHMGKGARDAPRASVPELLEETIDAANSLELQQAPLCKLLTKGSSGGELVEKEDLWNCLFRKAKKHSISLLSEREKEIGCHLRAAAAADRQ
ncbi:MAG: hypothetical protein M1830_003461 [Pleopsidium flavum]|nr:MAG: hypothetical protein M1830_003461 [Pleopsidium flavum]